MTVNRFCSNRSWACTFPAEGRAVEQVYLMGAVPDAVAQHVDGAALGDLALQPGEKLAPCRALLGECQCFGGLRLRCAQKGGELDEVDAVFPVVVVWVAAIPAHAPYTTGGSATAPLAGGSQG